MRMIVLSILAAFTALAIGSFSVQAADSACKGLTNTACTGNAGCSWVKPYKRKGKDVAGFCRKKVSRKPAASKASG